jgi:uncharacterized protein YegP (UPF0339 family)
MLGNYEIFKDKAGKFRFRLVASNGEIIAASEEGFESRQICENTIELMRTCALEAKILDFTARACPTCGVMIRADSNYCDQCGTHLDWQPK